MAQVTAAEEVPGTRAVVSFIAPYGSGAWHWFGIQAALNVLSIGFGLATPALAAVAIDQAIDGHLGWGLAGLAAVLGGSALAGMATPLAASRFGVALGSRLTRSAVAHALDIGLPGRRPLDDGDILNRAASLAPYMGSYATLLLRVGTGLAMVVGSVVALLIIDWRFVVVWLAAIGLLAVLARRLVAILSSGQSEYDAQNGRIVNAYTDALAGRRTIRAAGTLDREVERVTEPLAALVAAGRRILRTMGRGAVALATADHGVLIATALAGVWLLAIGEVTAGALLAAVRYAQMAYGSAAGVFDNGWFHLALFRAQAGKVMGLFQLPAANPARASTQRDGETGAVVFEDVAVQGTGGTVVRNVNLRIPRGTTLAVVGESGVGKTTLGALIGRLFDPEEGQVRIDGASLPGWSPEELARTVAYAFESPALLGDTIRDAITLGLDADDKVVRAAAKRAAADGFIERLPQGYETPLHDAPMSGGERQRLGLARAALRDPPILVLDDALSSLDVATSSQVLAALRSMSSTRTTILIAHRASTAAAADLVAWLVNGEIAQVAPHADLWRDPAYRGAFMEPGVQPSPAAEEAT